MKLWWVIRGELEAACAKLGFIYLAEFESITAGLSVAQIWKANLLERPRRSESGLVADHELTQSAIAYARVRTAASSRSLNFALNYLTASTQSSLFPANTGYLRSHQHDACAIIP